jgi:membrane protein DedA with SNARE-associated domain
MRSLISIPAGFRRMAFVPSTLYTLLGSLVWNLILIGAGYLLGERWGQVEEPLELFKNAVLVAIAVAIGWYVWRRFVRPRMRRTTG